MREEVISAKEKQESVAAARNSDLTQENAQLQLQLSSVRGELDQLEQVLASFCYVDRVAT
jgi:hypothetical protein